MFLNRLRKRIWGDSPKAQTVESETVEPQPEGTNNLSSPGGPCSPSSTNDTTPPPLPQSPCPTTTSVKTTKVERRASGASRFLKSLRNHALKEPKEPISFIALKELDQTHSLSPEGKRNNPGYNSTACRNKSLEITRSQSFQEKRLLVTTSCVISSSTQPPQTSSIPPTIIPPPKVKHARAQSFLCNNSQFFIGKQQQTYQNLQSRFQHQQQNIYAVPKPPVPTSNVKGLGQSSKKIETIYENLEVIANQSKMAIENRPLINRRLSNESTYMNIDMISSEGKKTHNDNQPTIPPPEGPPNHNNERKLRRSVSELPAERFPFPKKIPFETSHKAVYSSIVNGLSIWKSQKSPSITPSNNVGLSGSSSALYSSASGLYHSIPKSPYPTVYSTLPRNTPNASVKSLGENVGILSLRRNRNHGSATPTPGSSSSTPIPLSSARSTPNLGIGGKVQILRNGTTTPVPPPYPIYRDPPIYTPLGSLNRNLSNFKSKSSENVKLVEQCGIQDSISIYGRKLSTSSCGSNTSTSTLEPQTSNGETNYKCETDRFISESSSCSEQPRSSDIPSIPNMSGSSSSSWLKESLTNPVPVRDSASLKHIRYGPGHEKYPSWPIPAGSVAEVDPTGNSNTDPNKITSSRSKSWTDQTDYPKEKSPSYARPYMKKPNPAFTQQLKTVMEKCESYKGSSNNPVSPQALLSDKSLKLATPRGYQSSNGTHVLAPPLGYRDIYSATTTEKEYNIPSPPERDGKPLTQEDVEMYSKKYEELISQYAQSEGYHSYISSECSSSSYVSSSGSSQTQAHTPFLDLLRRESGELMINQQFWSQELDPNDPLFGTGINNLTTSGRESVTTVVTNSSSNSNASNSSSGTETLKCYGSASDISLASTNSNSNRWEQGVIHSAKVSLPQKIHSENLSRNLPNNKGKGSWSPPTSDLSSREINLKKFPLSTYTRPGTLSLEAKGQQRELNSKDTSPTGSVGSIGSSHGTQPSSSPIIDTSKPPSVAERIWELEKKQGASSTNISGAKDKAPSIPNVNTASNSNGVLSTAASSTTPSTTITTTTASFSSLPFIKSQSLPKITTMETLPLTSSVIQSIKNKEQAEARKPPTSFMNGNTTNKTEAYKNLWTNGEGNNGNEGKGNGGGESNGISYSYLDPEKKHKVADMTLKAIQKKALLSYYERHKNEASQQNSKNGASDTNQVEKTEKEDMKSSSGGERLGFMSKFNSTGQLGGTSTTASHDGTGWKSTSSLGNGGGVGVVNANNGAVCTKDALNNEPIIPPERPPKKPHLRQQVHSEDDSKPPPTLPRAPTRPPPSTSAPITSTTVVTGPPPVPSKPVLSIPVSTGVAVARSPSPDLPPPPPPIVEEEVEVITNDEPLPPPPSNLNLNDGYNRSRPPSGPGMSSYLHKDSYLAQRKERTLGYEGRYRRTLSPGPNGNKSSEPSSGGLGLVPPGGHGHSPKGQLTNATSTGKLDTCMTPSAWEKYHNIRPPSTTVIFTSHEIPNPISPSFHRSISCDSNLFNNKTGFTQSTIPPPVAQVAPIRDPYYGHHHNNHHHNLHLHGSSLELEKGRGVVEPFHQSSSSASSSSSLTFSPSPVCGSGGEGSDLNLYNDHNCSNTTNQSSYPTKTNTVMVSPLKKADPPTNRGDSPSPIKKSELSLKVNVSDVASQTEGGNGNKKSSRVSSSEGGTSPSIPSRSSSSSCSSSFDEGVSNKSPLLASVIGSYTGRQKTQEELECEELSRCLIKKLPQGDKLQQILVPLPEHKTTADYMEGLFQMKLKPEKSEKETNTSPRLSPDLLQSLPKGGKNPPMSSPPPPQQQAETNKENPKGGDGNDMKKRCNGHAPLPADSAYFTTSECKAKFLTQYVKDMQSNTGSPRSQDGQELKQQKEMLVSRISRKLEILRTEQLEIREEIESNEQLGQQVIERVKQSAKRNEFDKFKLHVEEIEKITSLLLGLSGRLARAENALMSLSENPNPQESKILESKRDKLREQLDEAKILKENIDRRSAQVSTFLQKYLTAEDYADYHHFVKMKAKLIIDAREIDDKIKLGEEQMIALKDTLNSSSS